MRRLILLAAVLTLGAPRGAMAQGGGVPMVSGRVFDDTTGCPLRGAAISAAGSPARTTTDVNGRYHLGGLPATPFVLQATLAGYAMQATESMVVTDSAMRVDFSLLRVAADSSVTPRVRYPAMKCSLEPKNGGGT